MYVRNYVCMYVYMYVCMHMYLYMDVYLYVYMYMCMCMCKCIYIHIYGHPPALTYLGRPLFLCKYRQNAYFSWIILPFLTFHARSEVMSLYNVVPTHVRFNINMPVLTSKKHFKRPHVTTGETKKTKIQNLSEGPETVGFFGFPTEIQKNHMFF